MVIAIVRVRGVSGIKPDIRKTMDLLKLHKKHHCVIYPKMSKQLEGMLKLAKDYITWGEISKDTLKELVLKRGRLPGNKRIDPKDVDMIVKQIENGEETEIKPVFRLNSPRKGWKNIKLRYPDGALGPRGKDMDELILRMI
ncbi:MAG: 50S ribosomal protein L30 [Candidatus Micrarchaeota archaeon]|nr:50S ribosomal protein L30 [Candidatus Micrarchaeota archaeon]